MTRIIREDFDGVVQAYERNKAGDPIGQAYRLPAGAEVPDGVDVPEHVLEPVSGPSSAGGGLGTFDPSTSNMADVHAYLAGAGDAERRRVLALEARGEARKGILVDGPYAGLAPAPDDDTPDGQQDGSIQDGQSTPAKKAAAPRQRAGQE